jgi:hypothetical protein
MPPETEVADPPATVDPEVSIDAMTSQQQEDWCLWYAELAAGGPGHPATPDLPVNEAGTTTNGACRIGSYCQAVVPVLSAAQCAANLSLSECEVPLSMLSECVADVLGGFCSAAQYACVDFLDSPGCPGTIVAASSSGIPMCGVAVE